MMKSVNQSLYDTVFYVEELLLTIDDHVAQVKNLAGQVKDLNAQVTKLKGSLEANGARAKSETVAAMPKTNIEVISKSSEEILGTGKPCGQILRIALPSGQDIYATCINAGMTVYEGKCSFHSLVKKTTGTPSAPSEARPAVLTPPASSPATPEPAPSAPVAPTYAAVAQTSPDKK